MTFFILVFENITLTLWMWSWTSNWNLPNTHIGHQHVHCGDGVDGLITPSVRISDYNSVKSGGPTSISEHNPQQFQDQNRMESSCDRGMRGLGIIHMLRASLALPPWLTATSTNGRGRSGFGPTPLVPFPLLRGSRQESSRSRQIFRVCREHWSSRYYGIERCPWE